LRNFRTDLQTRKKDLKKVESTSAHGKFEQKKSFWTKLSDESDSVSGVGLRSESNQSFPENESLFLPITIKRHG
jgi:hypothetical protein